MPVAELNGVCIHYDLRGDVSLPMLVLSNSLGANLSMWEPQVNSLGSRCRLLRYDTRGHGGSSIPPRQYTIAELGQDVVHLLDFLEIEQASFCGISMGGIIGQWLGVNAPNRLRKLILANTAAKIGVEEVWNTRIETVLRDGLGSVIPGTLERWFTPSFHAKHPDVITATAAMLHATDVQGYAACCAAIRDADFRASLQFIHAPTLVIAGTHDPVTTPEDGHFLAQHIPRASYVEIPAAHLSNIEAASEFNAALFGFLEA
ncbi:3-oxoadipate enol-lactonase [Acidicapsa acidisoli]|uniref:3-oxoadipate enol-lactonase n=1 Tax=Acidicapsa acidisoli TaxID=1615681 RepID=UPI0021E05956|nr:3-oxoadipate enol-lactonase [Acidicapsa acidisoli]